MLPDRKTFRKEVEETQETPFGEACSQRGQAVARRKVVEAVLLRYGLQINGGDVTQIERANRDKLNRRYSRHKLALLLDNPTERRQIAMTFVGEIRDKGSVGARFCKSTKK